MLLTPEKISYPAGDGAPVAESYAHMYVMFITFEILRQYLAGRRATVLANQFLYYAQGFPKLRVAPDVMVIFDVAPGGRDSYKIWEELAVPSVIFEITSKITQNKDQEYKKDLYEALGVREYWLFDPKGEWIEEQLRGYQLVEDKYSQIRDGISRVLQLRLEPSGELINFYRLDNGQKLLTPEELAQAVIQEQQSRQNLVQKLLARGIDPDSF